MDKIYVCLVPEMHDIGKSFIKLKAYKMYHSTHSENDTEVGRAILTK